MEKNGISITLKLCKVNNTLKKPGPGRLSLLLSLPHSLTYSLTYSLTHLLTHSLTYSLTHSLAYSLTFSFPFSLSVHRDGADGVQRRGGVLLPH